jgi:aminoglycoside phosphotransferase (APT) family kinase protein
MDDPFTREYSKRLGVLTGGQLRAALTRFGLGELRAAGPAPGGLFGQNVFVTSSSGEYVLRGAPHYDGQFERERYFCGVIHERTEARAPWPFLIEKSPKVFGWSFAMMPLLPGVHLSDRDVQRSLTGDDRLGIARAMGAYLPLIQQATWDAPGDYDYPRAEVAPLEVAYADWFAGRTRDWLARCRQASGATTADDVAWVESVIAAARPSLGAAFTPVLVHTDYAEGNVVAERAGKGWRICGVFDLGDAYAGDSEYDLARLACWYGRRSGDELRAFIDAYTDVRPPRAGFEGRLSLYILAERLTIWEYGQRNGIWFTDPRQTLRAWAEPFVAIAEAAARV